MSSPKLSHNRIWGANSKLSSHTHDTVLLNKELHIKWWSWGNITFINAYLNTNSVRLANFSYNYNHRKRKIYSLLDAIAIKFDIHQIFWCKSVFHETWSGDFESNEMCNLKNLAVVLCLNNDPFMACNGLEDLGNYD